MPKSGKKRARSSAYDELMPADLKAALERRAAQQEEYGTWVASMDITVPFQSSLAYTKGSPVPKANVERWDYDMPENYMGQVCVVERGTKEYDELFDPNTTATIALSMDSVGASTVHPELVTKVADAMQTQTSAIPASGVETSGATATGGK